MNSALPPQRHKPDTWPEHQDHVSHMAQKKREKGREKERKKDRKKERKKGRKKEQKGETENISVVIATWIHPQ